MSYRRMQVSASRFLAGVQFKGSSGSADGVGMRMISL